MISHTKLDAKNKEIMHKKWISTFNKNNTDHGAGQGFEGECAMVQNTLMQMQDTETREKYEKF